MLRQLAVRCVLATLLAPVLALAEPPVDPRPELKPDPSKIRVACIGDSITFGYGIKDPADTYPALLQKLLGDKYQVANFGNSGRGIILSSKRGSEWRAYLKQKSHEQALAFRPDIVICNLGVNDIDAWKDGHRAEFVPDYLTLLKAYQELPSKPRIFVWSRFAPILPASRCHKWPEIFAMRGDMAAVCERSGALPLDMFAPLLGLDGAFQGDGLHPNEKGAKAIAEATFAQIKPWLEIPADRLELPYVFGDHLLVQHGKPLPIRGCAAPEARVMATLSGQAPVTAKADRFGRFELTLPALRPGGPYTLTVATPGKKRTFSDVMAGELWLCAGQSNMAFTLREAAGAKEAVAASTDGQIRCIFRGAKPGLSTGKARWSLDKMLDPLDPAAALTGDWKVLSPATAPGFPAVPYFFARELRKTLKMPVGILCVAVGGTTTESLIPELALVGDKTLVSAYSNGMWTANSDVPAWTRNRGAENLALWFARKPQDSALPGHYFQPDFLARGGIEPLGRLPVGGVIWYQGESNATSGMKPDVALDSGRNLALLTTLVKSWRAQFGAELPFLFVQLPNLNRPWMEYRLMQDRLAKELPGVWLATTIDVCNPTNVHPTDKASVGHRLARLALHNLYGRKELVPCGPRLKSATVRGGSVALKFDWAAGKLATVDGKAPRTFEVAGADRQFKPAAAAITGPDTVTLTPEAGSAAPAFVRYAYSENPPVNLVNGEKFPTQPFLEPVAP